jgi:hypothetical protein
MRRLVPRRARVEVSRRLPTYVNRRLRGVAERRWAVDSGPPEPIAGQTLGPPDFVGVGVMKSGTSWWYRQICTHPDVYDDPRVHKEVHYFDQFADRSLPDSVSEEYAAWFSRPPGKRRGEWTPSYVQDRWILELVARSAPSAKVLVLLRDPLPRLLSHLNHVRSSGRVVDTHSLRRSIESSYYFDRLTDVFAAIPADRVLVLQYEKCRADPGGELRRTLDFLDLDPDLVPPQERDEWVPGAGYRTELPEHVMRFAGPAIAEQARRAAEEFGCIDLDLWSC